MIRSLEERFWEKVAVRGEDECWEWIAGTDADGYGRIGVSGISTKAHRVSWNLHFGEIPEGMLVLHKCDFPPCVNPNHLFLGTDADNAKDREEKHRGKYGELHPRAKLRWEDVRAIRKEYVHGVVLQSDIANRYGVDKSIISCIINNKLWREQT